MNVEKIKLIMYWSGIAFFFLLELKLSYRNSTVSKFKRWITNIPLSLVNGVIYYVIYYTAISGLLIIVSEKKLGLLNNIHFPHWVSIVMGIVILDIVIYIWHLLNHEVPFLWRFHRVHHCDMNMDVSTANRFHIGELLISGILRMAVIYSVGISFTSYILFEIIVNTAIQFHHSSIKISHAFEKVWMLLFVPPSMHRIHHSVKIKEKDSNYGVIFSLWDRFLGTLVKDTDQNEIIIGIGSHRNFNKLSLFHMMIMPFIKKSL